MFYILCTIVTVVTPFYIVGIWRKRPVWSFVLAALVLFFLSYLTRVLQSMDLISASHDQSNLRLLRRQITQIKKQYILVVIITLPLLFVFQLYMLRRDKK